MQTGICCARGPPQSGHPASDSINNTPNEKGQSMKIEIGLNPNCSEAVFRFHTEDTEVARKILQAFANEVAAAYGNPPETIPCLTKIQQVEGVSFGACAGLGEPTTRCRWEPKKKAFVLCIGNNDLSPDGEGCRTVRELGIQVEEAETSPSLAKRWARDCACGIEWFEDYPGRIVEKAKPANPKPESSERRDSDANRVGTPG